MQGSGEFRAGAATVDVTPPALLGTWGHGPGAPQSRGHRGRLRCRVVYLEDARGERVVFMPCDFAAVSVNLQRAVAAAVEARVGMGADRLVLSATHTHGGPAHMFGAPKYSGLVSAKVAGYDAGFVDWLAARLAAGIVAAHDGAVPARVAWQTELINRGGGSGPAISANRSVEAHCANSDPMGAAATTCGGAADPIAEVTGQLDLLRIDGLDNGQWRPLAIYASFPVHGTSMPSSTAYFQGDLWGFAARYVEAKLRGDGSFVAALANGAEGDVQPAYGKQGWDEARRLGRLLGARIVEAHGRATTWEEAPRVAVAYRDLRLSEASGPPGSGPERLCAGPEIGLSAPGGSEEGRTRRYGRRMHEGITTMTRRDCQRPKGRHWILRWARRGFPGVAPLMAVGVGRGVVLAYPWEMTTTAGLRTRALAAKRAGLGDGPVALVGLANEYVQYLATPEEYAQQHYEGASTLFGAGSFAVVSGHLADLAVAMRLAQAGGATVAEMEPIRMLHPMRGNRFVTKRVPVPPRLGRARGGVATFDGLAAIDLPFLAGHPATLRPAGELMARVENLDADGRFVAVRDPLGDPLDDTHEDLLILYQGPEFRQRAHAYRAIWVPEPGTPAGDYRIVIVASGTEHAGPAVAFEGRP